MNTFYERIGGEVFFIDLVSRFYANVATNPILRPMYPHTDMKGAARRLQLFLEQYWGGPTTYSDERGHPRLRMRHGGFFIDEAAHDAWLSCMGEALEGMELASDLRAELWKYLESAARHLINQPD